MELADAASYFDNMLCVDAYSSASFYGQLDLFDDVKKDGLGAARRILSVSPSVTIPASRVAVFENEYWIIGAANKDSFGGSAVRVKHPVQLCDGLAQVQTPEQVIAGTGGTSVYTNKVLIKMRGEDSSAKLFNEYQFFFSMSDGVSQGQIISHKGFRFLARTIAEAPSDFLMITADQLDDPTLESVVYTTKTYQPLTDDYSQSEVHINALRLQWETVYSMTSQASPDYKVGDCYALIRKMDITLAIAGDTVLMTGGLRHIVSVQDEGGCWGLHLRHD